MTDNTVERPRLIVDRGDFKIYSGREYVRVILSTVPPRGIRGRLRQEGFRQRREGVWDAPHNPANIMTAQAIGSAFFPGEN